MRHRPAEKAAGLLLALLFLCVSAFSFPFAGAESRPGVPKLATGTVVNARIKSLAAGTETEAWTTTGDVRAIRMADALPEGFVPSEANTVSAPDAGCPVYIFFDNEGDAGILYFYTEGGRIVLNPDSYILFAGHEALTDISGVAGWDTSGVRDMYAMFAGDRSLPDALALREWDTSAVTDMSLMFSGDTSLEVIDVSNWNTGSVVSMAGMFQVGQNWEGNGRLREITGLGSLDVSNVADMTSMFYGAGQMTGYDIADWDVSKVVSMNHMFCDNFKLLSLDLSRWDVSSVKTMYCMFNDCQALTTIGDVSHWNTASLIDAGGWLSWAQSFVGDPSGILDLSGWDTSNLKAAGQMFLAVKARMIDLSGWTFDSATNDSWDGAGSGIFYETGNGTEPYRGLGEMFKHTSRLAVVYLSQAGMDSFHAAEERGVSTLDMWASSTAAGFLVK